MIIVLDAKKMGTKEDAHRYLRNVIGFPKYYGNNLDALYDCLSERRDLTLEIRNAQLAGEYFEQVLEVMQDACKVMLLD